MENINLLCFSFSFLDKKVNLPNWLIEKVNLPNWLIEKVNLPNWLIEKVNLPKRLTFCGNLSKKLDMGKLINRQSNLTPPIKGHCVSWPCLSHWLATFLLQGHTKSWTLHGFPGPYRLIEPNKLFRPPKNMFWCCGLWFYVSLLTNKAVSRWMRQWDI